MFWESFGVTSEDVDAWITGHWGDDAFPKCPTCLGEGCPDCEDEDGDEE